ncbi:ROK family protein [Paenibacillus sp. HN-1]|uniref:ROK family protein n=1 Tax=Paenibacillus TaxID=44249 RepID=UPI001CA87BE2|nr:MULTISPECIES: ROK family protein [Paenibacillus]MBY9078621.1 ROK family protein [Paenibacillus sp. CGMCC 1.18879]MBY9084157.1 ROK family protein [Paenibacillus sinensis]
MRIAAADIGGTNIKTAICDENGTVSEFREFPTESRRGGPVIFANVLDKLAEYRDFDAIAISTAGQVNAEEGFIVYANENIPGYTGLRIKEIAERRFHIPVKVENDVNAAALGEGRYGAAESLDHYLCLTFGTGIGGAIVADRRIYKGAGGVAAEFGHMLTRPVTGKRRENGLPYYEHYASATALVRLAAMIDPECIDGKILFSKIDGGDERLRRALLSWADEAAAGLASLIHIFNPAAIVLGGGIMERADLVQLVEERTRSLIMDSFSGVKLIKASLGNKAGLLGAASLFLK